MVAFIVRMVAGVRMFLLPGFAAREGVRETNTSPQLLARRGWWRRGRAQSNSQ